MLTRRIIPSPMLFQNGLACSGYFNSGKLRRIFDVTLFICNFTIVFNLSTPKGQCFRHYSTG